MYPVSLAEEKKKTITASFLSFCSYQVDDTLNFPADKNFVQLQSVLPTAESPQVLICLTGGFIHSLSLFLASDRERESANKKQAEEESSTFSDPNV